MSAAKYDERVLIVAAEPMAAALIGALVDSTRLQAAFPNAGESPLDAVVRVRPLAAILIDAVLDDSGSDVFLARVRATGALTLLFGSARHVEFRSAWAREQGVPTFSLPDHIDDLTLALHSIQPRRRAGERRARSGRTADGTLYYDDGKTCWYVYDRRTTDRRAQCIDRRFVSERGEVRHCMLTENEAEAIAAGDLETQLAHAH